MAVNMGGGLTWNGAETLEPGYGECLRCDGEIVEEQCTLVQSNMYYIKMTNSLRLTRHVLLCARLHVSVFSEHHQAFLRINSKNAGLHFWIPSMFTVCTSVYICHMNTLKSEDKMVIGKCIHMTDIYTGTNCKHTWDPIM